MMSTQQNYYREKYLKYKKKYLTLKMNGGANCANFGFKQHTGECWHDSLSMIFCYCDGIGETIQEIFKSEESFNFFYNDINIDELNGIPIELIPPNYDLDIKEEKEKLLNLVKYYFNYIYERYSNEQKVDLRPIIMQKLTQKNKDIILDHIIATNYYTNKETENKIIDFMTGFYDETHNDHDWYLDNMDILLEETGLSYIEPSALFRANSMTFSLECVRYIHEIVKHNNLNVRKKATTGGTIIDEIIAMCIVSYFLLNYPLERLRHIQILQRAKSVTYEPIQQLERKLSQPSELQLLDDDKSIQKIDQSIQKIDQSIQKIDQSKIKFLSSKIFDFQDIFTQYNSVENIIKKLNEIKDILGSTLCVLIISNLSKIEYDEFGNSYDAYGNIYNDEYINTLKINHAQCFFKCNRRQYFYDDNGIAIDKTRKLFVNFDWKEYLNKVIDSIILQINDHNKKTKYKLFSSFYQEELKYPYDLEIVIKHMVFIEKTNYTKEVFTINFLDNLKYLMYSYNNNNILNIVKNNIINNKTLLELLYTSLQINNKLIFNELLNKENSRNCLNIIPQHGVTLLHVSIYIRDESYFPLLLEHPNISDSFIIQDYNGSTPLHQIVYRGKLDFLKKIIINPKIENCFTIQDFNDGNTPLHIALLKLKEYEYDNDDNDINKKIVDILMQHEKISICYEIKNKNGYTVKSLIQAPLI